jgi:hypothetical protein
MSLDVVGGGPRGGTDVSPTRRPLRVLTMPIRTVS